VGGAVLLVASLIAYTVHTRGYLHLLRSDAPFFFSIATDPFGDGHALRAAPDGSTAYRYGRIGVPLLVWALALGKGPALLVTFPLVYLAGIALLVGVSARGCQQAGRSPLLGLLVLIPLAPTAPEGLIYLVPEAMYTGLILLVYWCVGQRHPRAALVAAAGLLLTRETAALALAPLVLAALWRRDWRAVGGWTLSGVPLLLWYAWVRVRVGCWPFLDPAMIHAQPYGWPFRGFLLLASADPLLHHVVLMAWATLLTAWLLYAYRPSALGAAAAITASLLIVFGPGQATLPSEAVRLMGPMQILIIMALLTRSSGTGAMVRGAHPFGAPVVHFVPCRSRTTPTISRCASTAAKG
jgi:hypothetical protein